MLLMLLLHVGFFYDQLQEHKGIDKEVSYHSLQYHEGLDMIDLKELQYKIDLWMLEQV